MRTSKQNITATSKAFADAMQAARNHTDPDLTPEGLTKKREDMTAQVRAKYAKEIDGHRSALYIDHDRSAFDRYRPKLNWNNAGDVAKAQAKWSAVQAKLEAGMGIGQVIESADQITLAAISEFYGDYAETQHAGSLAGGQQYEIPDTTAVGQAVEDRAADLSGNSGREALQTARQAAGLHAFADVTLAHLDRAVGGQVNDITDLHTAVAAEQAEGEAMAGGSSLVASEAAGNMESAS